MTGREGGAGSDELRGGDGEDLLLVSDGVDVVLDGGLGTDTIDIQLQNAVLSAGLALGAGEFVVI